MKYRVSEAWQKKLGVTCDTLGEAYDLAAEHIKSNGADCKMVIWEIQGAVKRFVGCLDYYGVTHGDTWYQMKREEK